MYLLVAFANFWIWRVIKINPFLGLVLILLSLTFGYLICIKFNKKILLIFLLLVLMTGYQVMVTGFDKNLVTITPDQQKKLDERHGYFVGNLGILFQNKFTLRFYKDIYPYLNVYQNNIFNSLAPNLYFFSNHPREREKIEEFAKYPSILLIPFLVGMVGLFSTSQYLILLYFVFALIITGFVKQSYLLGPILFFPLINFLITIGLFKIYQFFKR